MLKAEGRKSADEFLASHGADVGKRSSADLDIRWRTAEGSLTCGAACG